MNFVNKAKKEYIGKVTGTPITDESGKTIGSLIFVSNITEQKMIEEKLKTEELLKDSEEKYRILFEGANDGIIITDPETKKFVFVNHKICEMTGYTLNEILNMDMAKIHPEKDLPFVLEQFEKQFKDERFIGEDIPVLRKDGTIIYCNVNGRKIEIGKQVLLMGFFRDITERRQAEEKIRWSEEKYRAIFEGANDGIIIVDPETKKFDFANPKACEMTGYTLNELKRMGITEIHLEKDLPYVMEQFEKQLTGEISIAKDIPVLRKDGTIICCDINARKIDINNKTFLMGFFRDITERTKLENELKFTNVLLSTEQEASIDGILVVDEQGQIISFNRRFVDMWNIPSEVIESKSDERALQSVLSLLVEPGEFLEKVHYLYEHHHEMSCDEIILRDGRAFDRYSAPLLEDGRIYLGRLWSFRDITARKLAEKKLLVKNWAIESAINAIVIFDLNWKLNYVNPAFLKLWKYGTPAEVLGRSLFEFWQRSAGTADIPEILNVRGDWLGEVTAIGRDGSFSDVQVAASMIKDHTGQPICMMASFMDITESKEMHKHLAETEKLAAMSQFIAGAAHELNNPLTSIIGFSEMASRHIENTKMNMDKLRNFIRIIQNNAGRCKKLVGNLITYGRGIPHDLAPVDINETLNEALILTEYPIIQKDIKVVKEFSNDLPQITGSKVPLSQVFINIIQNACLAMQNNGLLNIRTEKAGDYINIIFKDDGMGIKKEYINRIFDPFFTTREVGEGNGLGLSICHGIIKTFKGDLTAKSEGEGKGSVFTVRLPTGEK